MTMRQLRDLLEELSGQGQAPAQEEGVESQPTEESAPQGQGKGGHGQGQNGEGRGQGTGQGRQQRKGKPS